MKTWMTLSTLTLLGATLVGCQQPAPSNQASSPAPAASGSPAAATTDSGAAPAAPAQTVAQVDICSLLSAAEVSAIMGKPLIQSPHSCDYGLDPAAKQKALADAGVKPGASDAENLGAMMQSFSKGGKKKIMGTTNTMMDQLNLTLSGDPRGMSEEKAKELYSKVGGTVNQALHPDDHNLHEVIQVADEIAGVGDWAFATNVASVNMMGMSMRGRTLEVGKGSWRLTIGVTIAPDPGTAVLDQKMADVAKALIAKMPS